MAQNVINAATAAGASTIGLPHATATFAAEVATAYKLSYHLPGDALTWLQGRSDVTILADPNTKGLPTQNALMKQTRAIVTKTLDDTYFELQAVTQQGKETAKYLRLKNGYRQRVLFLDATIEIVKKYYGDPLIDFVLPDPSPNTVTQLHKFIARYKRARGDTRLNLLPGELPARVYANYVQLFDLKKKYHTLMGVDVAYALSKLQVDYLMEHFGAMRLVHIVFLPPELQFPYVPKNPYYGVEFVSMPPLRDRGTLSADIQEYLDLTEKLKTQWRCSVCVSGEWVHVESYKIKMCGGKHTIHATDEAADDEHIAANCKLVNSRDADRAGKTSPPYDGSVLLETMARYLDTLDGLWARLVLNKPELTWTRLGDIVYKKLFKILYGEQFTTAHVWFEGQGNGSFSCGYYNDWKNWKNYTLPGWEVKSFHKIAGEKVRNYSLTVNTQCGYHVMQTIVRHTHGGPLVNTWRLHPADEHCRVMNVEESLTRFGKGVKKSLVYESFPSRIVGELMVYLMSLANDSLLNPDAPANALLWLRKRLIHVVVGNQADGKVGPQIPVEKMVVLAYGAYFQVLDEKSLFREARAEFALKPTIESRIRSWFFSAVDQTLLGDFITWLVRARWYRKFVLGVKPMVHNRVFLSEQLDFGRKYDDFMEGIIYDEDELDAPNLPPVDYTHDGEPLVQKTVEKFDMPKITAKFDCMICEAANSCGITHDTMICRHNDPEVEMSIKPDEWRKFMLECGQEKTDTPAQITALNEQVKEVFKGFEEIQGKARVYNITGLPGTGKSYLLRALGVYLREKEGIANIGLYSPFSKLYNEYKWEALDHMGKPLGKLFTFKTTHRAMLEFVGLKYIFVEEFGAVNFNMFAPLVQRNPGVTFVCCGDVNQTQLQAHEGKNVYQALDVNKLNDHTLTLNRRNPPDHVEWANNFIKGGLKMRAHKKDRSPVQIYDDIGKLSQDHPNWSETYDVFSFGSDTFKLIMGDQSPDGNPIRAVTVRSCQGSTFKKGVLLLHPRDTFLMQNDSMSLVALTRCTDLLVIYVAQTTIQTSAWFARCQLKLDHESLNLPRVDFREEEHEPEEPLLRKPKMPATAVAEALTVGRMDQNIPLEQDFDEVEVAHGVPAEATTEIGKYTENCDAGVALTHAGNPVRHEPERLQLANIERNLPNYAVQEKIASSALRRANALLPNKQLSIIERTKWQYIIDKYFETFKHKVFITESQFVAIWKGLMEDAQQRHYWERLMSANPENPEPDMIGVQDFVERCTTTPFLQEAIQRLSVKEGMKMNNSAKVDSIFAAAQTIATQPVWQWFQFSFLERFTAMIDKLSDNVEKRPGKGVLLSRHGESDKAYVNKANRLMSETFGGRVAEMAYSDGAKTDSGGTMGSVEVLEMYRCKLITYACVSSDTEHWFFDLTHLMYKTTRGNPALAAHVRFQSKHQTPSGYVGTFSDAMVYCSLSTFAMVETTGDVFMQKGGDDGALVADHISDSLQGQELVDRTSNIQLRVIKSLDSERVLDFTGMLIYSGVDCVTGDVYNCVVPNIVRKRDKVFGALYKDVKHIGEAMVSVRKLAKEELNGVEMTEDLVYVNAAHYKSMHSVDMSTAIEVVKGYCDELVSLSCTKAKDIAAAAAVHRRPADPRSVEIRPGSGVYMQV